MIDSKLKYFIINTLRRSSFRWKERGIAEKRYRVPNGTFKNGKTKYGYQCAHCEEVFMKKDVKLDHIIPVVGEEGFTTFDVYIERMFCDSSNFQCLCEACHDIKSAEEKDLRKEYRKKNKE